MAESLSRIKEIPRWIQGLVRQVRYLSWRIDVGVSNIDGIDQLQWTPYRRFQWIERKSETKKNPVHSKGEEQQRTGICIADELESWEEKNLTKKIANRAKPRLGELSLFEVRGGCNEVYTPVHTSQLPPLTPSSARSGPPPRTNEI